MFDTEKYSKNELTNGYKNDGTKLKVLIVDDSMAQRRLLGKMLGDVGYEIAGEAYDGGNALIGYKQLSPDVVTMDITMPGMEGDEVVKNIIQYDSQARIVMVTSLADKGHIIDCINSGAKGYILKPIISSQIYNTLITLKKAATGD